jgi:cytochrome c
LTTEPIGEVADQRELVPCRCGDSRMRSLVLVLGAGILATVPGYAQDAASGEKIFVQCKACHQIGENAKNAVGPVLNGLFGRKAGMIEGYSYSAANKNSGITWDEATFREYIRDPKAKIPGTKMTFPGLKDPKQIDDIVAYLKQFDSTGKKAGIVPAGRTREAAAAAPPFGDRLTRVLYSRWRF